MRVAWPLAGARMPTYLRWIAALTSGLTAQFAYYIIFGAVAVGTDNKELTGGIGLLRDAGQCRGRRASASR